MDSVTNAFFYSRFCCLKWFFSFENMIVLLHAVHKYILFIININMFRSNSTFILNSYHIYSPYIFRFCESVFKIVPIDKVCYDILYRRMSQKYPRWVGNCCMQSLLLFIGITWRLRTYGLVFVLFSMLCINQYYSNNSIIFLPGGNRVRKYSNRGSLTLSIFRTIVLSQNKKTRGRNVSGCLTPYIAYTCVVPFIERKRNFQPYGLEYNQKDW